MTLQLSQAGFRRLAAALGRAVTMRDRHPVVLGPGLYGPSLFYAAEGRFSLLAVCNHWSAGLLNAAGVPVTPLLDTLPRGLVVDLACARGRSRAEERYLRTARALTRLGTARALTRLGDRPARRTVGRRAAGVPATAPGRCGRGRGRRPGGGAVELDGDLGALGEPQREGGTPGPTSPAIQPRTGRSSSPPACPPARPGRHPPPPRRSRAAPRRARRLPQARGAPRSPAARTPPRARPRPVRR